MANPFKAGWVSISVVISLISSKEKDLKIALSMPSSLNLLVKYLSEKECDNGKPINANKRFPSATLFSIITKGAII
jgi:hypothetical protein